MNKLKTWNNRAEQGFSTVEIVIVILVISVAAFVGYRTYTSSKNINADKAQTNKISVKVGWLHQAQFAGLYVAKEKSYYTDVGLDVTLLEYEEGNDVTNEVATGKVDYGISTPLEIALSRERGAKVKALAAIYQTSPYVIVSRKEANIKTPADFKNKTLGNIGGNNQAKVTYAALMANAGLKEEDVTLKDIGFDIVQEFKAKSADTGDIYRNDQTYLLDQAGEPYDLIYPEQYGFSIYGDCLITSDTRISGNPAQARAFVEASIKGWEYAVAHRDETLTIVAKYENELYKDAAYEKNILDGSIPLISPTGNQKIGTMQYIPWNKAYQGAVAAGLIKSDVKAVDLYTTQFIE